MSLTNRKARLQGRRMFGAFARGAVVFTALTFLARLEAPPVWMVDSAKPGSRRRMRDNRQGCRDDFSKAKQRGWELMYDFDGDGKNDEIEVEFTGGAHCCYRLTVWLSLTGKRRRLPVFLDGGYVGGLDPRTQPNHFTIRKIDGSLPELLMEVNTYNGEPDPLPRSWKRRFKLKTNFVIVSFARGRLRVRDWPRQK